MGADSSVLGMCGQCQDDSEAEWARLAKIHGVYMDELGSAQKPTEDVHRSE